MPGSRSVVFDFLSVKKRDKAIITEKGLTALAQEEKNAFKLIDYFYFTTSTIIINICIYQYTTAFYDIKDIDLNPSQANSLYIYIYIYIYIYTQLHVYISEKYVKFIY